MDTARGQIVVVTAAALGGHIVAAAGAASVCRIVASTWGSRDLHKLVHLIFLLASMSELPACIIFI